MAKFPYENPVKPESVNMNADGIARVVEQFQSQQLSGSFPGGQLVVRRNGKLVLNAVVGIARGFRSSESISPVQVQSLTSFPVLSAGKPLAAIAIAMLEERIVIIVSAICFFHFARAVNGCFQLQIRDFIIRGG